MWGCVCTPTYIPTYPCHIGSMPAVCYVLTVLYNSVACVCKLVMGFCLVSYTHACCVVGLPHFPTPYPMPRSRHFTHSTYILLSLATLHVGTSNWPVPWSMWSCVWELCCSTLPWSYWESPPPVLMCKVHSATWAPPSSTIIWLLFYMWTDRGVCCMLVECITSNSASWHYCPKEGEWWCTYFPLNVLSRSPSGHPRWDSPSSLALSLSRLGGSTTSLARSLQETSTKPSSRWEQVLGWYECRFREGRVTSVNTEGENPAHDSTFVQLVCSDEGHRWAITRQSWGIDLARLYVCTGEQVK